MSGDTNGEPAPTWLDLYDWRLRMARFYQERDETLRAGDDEQTVLERFRAHKDHLFAMHPQSPLSPQGRQSFSGLSYFPYAPEMRVEATLVPIEDSEPVDQAGGGAMPLRLAARVDFTLGGALTHLPIYWIDVYGGSLFLPFRDATCRDESYGGGRYLFDTAKGSTFEWIAPAALDPARAGYAGGRIVLDFNYAYNPSCAYDARWLCPLARSESTLPLPIRAGERKYAG
ncbi:MAG TPA: DUF1684 domain-containing protein [Ktedonobacterales bacterium]|nr:DUF1684 domain-containing protein [Ktedonobacterales bacterium]